MKLRTSTSVGLPLALRRVRDKERARLLAREARRVRFLRAVAWASQDAPIAIGLILGVLFVWALLR